MARYEDYAKALEQNQPVTDDLEQEINDAATQTETRRDEAGTLPERFKGKSAEEIAQSFVELERLNSRQAQDLGQMRKTVDELLALQLQELRADDGKKPNTKPVTVDDLYERPNETIREVAEDVASKRVQSLEMELARERFEREKAAFSQQYPGWENDVHTPEFISWIHAKPHRVSLARKADQGDWSAADELFGTYYDQREVAATKAAKAAAKEQRKQQVRQVSLESPGAEVPDQTETFSRRKLMDVRLKAKRGDREATLWMKDNAERIAIAYEEGRIVD